MPKRSPSPRICEDCGTEVAGKYRRRRCENCYRAMLRRESGVAERSVVQGNPAAYALANSTPGHGGCVLFTGWTTKGYGRINTGEGRAAASAHRVVYEHLVGPVPDGLGLDHVCHTRSTTCLGGVTCLHRRCINPHHLEPVTTQENTRRAVERPNSRANRRALIAQRSAARQPFGSAGA